MEHANLISDYIDPNIDHINTKTYQEVKQFKVLLLFLQTTKEELEYFIKFFQKSFSIPKSSLIPETTLGSSIQILTSQYDELIKTLNQYGEKIERGTIKSMGAFIEKYERLNTDVLVKANKIIQGVNNQRQLYPEDI